MRDYTRIVILCMSLRKMLDLIILCKIIHCIEPKDTLAITVGSSRSELRSENMRQWFQKIGNSFMRWLLRSPLHGIVSKNVALISVRGKKTGQWYRVPVNYQRQAGTVWITSYKYRSWWKNLRGGASVIVRILGVDFNGRAEVHESPHGVTEGLKTYFRLAPEMARYFSVALDASGNPDPSDLARIVPGRVVIEITLE